MHLETAPNGRDYPYNSIVGVIFATPRAIAAPLQIIPSKFIIAGNILCYTPLDTVYAGNECSMHLHSSYLARPPG